MKSAAVPPSPRMPTPGERSGDDVLRAQILGQEHWSLFATRGAVWQEIFSRTATFLAILSATVVALSLVVQATGFGLNFRVIALLVLPLVLLLGTATYIRLIEADIEDAWLVIGMNRLRHAYVELVPGIERYLVIGFYDDEASLLQTYSFRRRVGATHLFAGSPNVVGIVNAVFSGVLAVIVGQALGLTTWLQIAIGVVVALSAGALMVAIFVRRLRKFPPDLVPQFPRPSED
uniref:hypothetical protein n=1 Tax=Paractinoplanes polyasparticus TaxID=2856853 RepID=UPI001C848C03|nr:hypothetical protein [Actinoplanes polyasparticus]